MQDKSNVMGAALRVAITGGTSGLGLALVREFLSRGANVAFVARGAERVDRVAEEQPGAHGIAGDVSAKDDIYPIAVQIAGELGGLDVLINNASDLGPAPLALPPPASVQTTGRSSAESFASDPWAVAAAGATCVSNIPSWPACSCLAQTLNCPIG